MIDIDDRLGGLDPRHELQLPFHQADFFLETVHCIGDLLDVLRCANFAHRYAQDVWPDDGRQVVLHQPGLERIGPGNDRAPALPELRQK